MPTVGFDGTITENYWSNIMWRSGEIAFRHGVWSGGVTTAAVGTRTVSVSAIDCMIAGIWHTTSSPTTVSLAANTSGNPRMDIIVAEADWSTNTVTIKAVQGTPSPSPVRPVLALGGGSLWQMQLARIIVPNGASTITAGQIELCRPLPRKPIVYRMDPLIQTIGGAATTWRGLGVLAIEDPGWSYNVWPAASVRFATSVGSGYMRIRITNQETGAVYGEGVSNDTRANKSPALIAGSTANAWNGPLRLQLEMLGVEYASTEQINVLDHPSNHFTLTVLPA